ncbi:hypothetical protein IFM89_024308 [Coptis chinensis]|uniref:Protein kinase domain-containing protein n=1 Tax=Coptis chinensis TaxID=261450 RepID=A0A835H665_9MAGN|nr:hypothetical protein IFM89_024308 [Coptis chinensis]
MEECNNPIIHCDIKPQNILLDEHFTARISNFGLAKLWKSDQSQTNTDNCCRRSVVPELRGENKVILTEWAYDCYLQARLDVLVEDDEEAMDDVNRLEKLVMVAIWCIQEEPSLRPTMRKITQMLEGAVEVSPNPSSFLSSRPLATTT